MFTFIERPFLLTLSALALVCSVQAATPTREHLESVYNTWRQAMVRGDIDIWRSCTAQFRQRMVRNLAVSEKKPFPKSLFMQQVRPPMIDNLKYVGVKIVGNTAAMTYFGKIDFGVGGEPTENAFVILFANEKGIWKYDTSRFFNMSRLPEIKSKLKHGDASVLDQEEGFKPTGVVPAMPPLCPAPQFIAKVFSDCPGRKIIISVNGISTHIFENTRNAEIISGGLHGGNNTISYKIADSALGKKGNCSVAIYIMPETPGNIPGKAYAYTCKSGEAPISGTYNFQVNKALLMTMKAPTNNIRLHTPKQ